MEVFADAEQKYNNNKRPPTLPPAASGRVEDGIEKGRGEGGVHGGIDERDHRHRRTGAGMGGRGDCLQAMPREGQGSHRPSARSGLRPRS